MNAIGQIDRRHSALFPDDRETKSVEAFLTEELAASIKRVALGASGPDIDLVKFRSALEDFDFDQPKDAEHTLRWVIGQLEHGVVHMTHPSYFGLFNPNPVQPAQWADRVAAAFNPQLATATTSPAAVEIEAHVVRAFAARAGLPQGSGGHFTTGGSEANFTAVICALTVAEPQYGKEGVRAFAGPPVMYVSEDAHVAWFKIAHQAGIGRSGVRVIATNGVGRMDVSALAAAIEQDRAAGCVPVLVAATAGTTGAGMIDPLQECASIARAHGLWFHVDAAWGGALLVSDERRGLLAGIEAADSVTLDAHKWLAMTMGCGLFITRRPSVLSAAFHVSASFMPSNDERVDPYVTSVQWSRRFIGLRLFVSLAVAGWSGFTAHVERAIQLTALLRDAMTSRGWAAANESDMAVLCLDPPAGGLTAGAVARAAVASNRAWVSVARFAGREVVRACVTNGQTTPDDILALAELLHGLATGDVPTQPTTGDQT